MNKNNKKDEKHMFRDDMQIMMEDVLKQTDFSVFRSDYLVGKFDNDNISKWMKHKEIKTIIHDFYKKEHIHINQFTDDEKYRELIFKLYQHLGYKSQFDDFTVAEKTLLHLIHTYTDSLINEFKNVLKEVEE